MNKHDQRAPQKWHRILKWLSSEHHRESTILDLDEIYEEMFISNGHKYANRWYRRQVLHSIPRLLRHRLLWEGALAGQAVRIASRRMRRDRMTTAINLVGLTVGLAVAGLVGVWIHYETSFDGFHHNSDSIYRVAFSTDAFEGHPNGGHGDYLPGPAGRYLAENYPAVESATALGDITLAFTHHETTQRSKGCFADPGFFDVFTFPVIEGDLEKAFDQQLSVVMTGRFAYRLFGDETALGKTVRLGGGTVLTVTGVLADPPQNSSVQFDFLIPMRLAPGYLETWQNKAARTYIRLAPQADPAVVSREIRDVYNRHNAGQFPHYLYLSSIKNMRLYDLDGGGRIRYVQLFATLAAVILLLAGINFTNLSTAWASIRLKEMGVRRATGAFRRQLAGQLLGETLFLSLITGILALTLIRLALPFASQLLGETLPWPPSLLMVGVLPGLALLTGLAAGCYPAIILSAVSPAQVLSGRGLGKSIGGSGRMRRLLVILQFTLSIGFIIGVAVIVQQIQFFRTADLGYDREDILVLTLDGTAGRNAVEIKEEVLKLSSVVAVSGSQGSLSRWNSSAVVDWQGKPEDLIFDTGRIIVDEDYAETLGLSMVKGRFFSNEFTSDRRQGCVINESLMRMMNVEEPVGMVLSWGAGTNFEKNYTVIGVVKNYHTESMHREIRPFFIAAGTGGKLHIRLQPGTARRVIPELEAIVSRIAPSAPFTYHFLDDELDDLYKEEQLTGRFVVLLAVLAIFIASLGLIGLSAFTASRRVKEIGIRKVLGASVPEVLRLVSQSFLVWVAAANVLAWPIAWWVLSRWLEQYPYRISLQWPVFVLAGVSTLLLAAATVSGHALKAAKMNPVKSLRYE